MQGDPDFIIEIVSPATLKKDLKEKFYLNERASVIEYWRVYSDEKNIVSYKLNENLKFGRPEVYSVEDKITISIFKTLEIDLYNEYLCL